MCVSASKLGSVRAKRGKRSLSDAGGNVQGRDEKKNNVSVGADTKETLRGEAAHLRLVIFVSLRMAASAEAPSSPMLLLKRLPSEGQSGNGER